MRVGEGGLVGSWRWCVSGGSPLIPLRSFLSAQDAKKDDAVRKAYKYLAALHEVRGEACLGLAGEVPGWGASLIFLLFPELQPAHPDH